ncbi:MAG: DUF448 domain-containing protein [Campylobacterales bacterium]|nr:DUF448 domain-containing protein [Campylobacterales bacterium]
MLKKTPTRMCIACRGRYEKPTLIRLQQKQKHIVPFCGVGRSFYLCCSCINDPKKIKGLTKRFAQNEEHFVKFLKEQIENGEN